MASFFVTGATLLSLANGLTLPRQAAHYHYMPTEYQYGEDSRVTTNITFGTAPDAQPVKIVMDSGSSAFWTFNAGAEVHWGSPYLGVIGPCLSLINPGYDNTTSPYLMTQADAYAYAGNAKIVRTSQYSNDTITVQGSIPIANVQFANADNVLIKQRNDGTCKSTPSLDQGILGLSPFESTSKVPSFRENLFTAGAILSRTMTMWFNAHPGPLGTLTGGTLFGAIDRSKFTGDLVRVPNAIKQYQVGFYVPKPVMNINGVIVESTVDTNCLVDSGAHADAIPIPYGEEEKAFFAQTGLIEYIGMVAYNGTCDSIPADFNIDYTFAGVKDKENITIKMPLRNYARGHEVLDPSWTGGDICVLNLETGSSCLFGAPFASAAFLAFDDADQSIAFAQGGVSDEGSGLDDLVVIGMGETFDSV